MAYTGNLIHYGQCTRALIHIMVFLNTVYSLSQEIEQINNLVNNMAEERFKDHWFCVVENCTRHKKYYYEVPSYVRKTYSRHMGTLMIKLVLAGVFLGKRLAI